MSHPDTLVTAASLIAGFGAAIMAASNMSALCFVVAPLVAVGSPTPRMVRLASAVCCASAIMLAGYIPSILAHYEFFFGLTKERTNPTFWEGIFLAVTAIGSVSAFAVAYRMQG